MSVRALAVLLLATAGLLHVGVTVPAREDAARVLEELRRQSEARRSARVRLTALERRAAVRRRAAATSAASAAEAPAALRRAVLSSLQEARVSGVRLDVRPAKPPIGATIHLTAEGPSADVVCLAGQLVGPDTGVYLSFVRFATTRDGELGLDVDGFSLGGRP